MLCSYFEFKCYVGSDQQLPYSSHPLAHCFLATLGSQGMDVPVPHSTLLLLLHLVHEIYSTNVFFFSKGWRVVCTAAYHDIAASVWYLVWPFCASLVNLTATSDSFIWFRMAYELGEVFSLCCSYLNL